MKQILVMMAAVVASLSVVADEVLINDPVLKEYLGKRLKKPYGKFAPPMKLTETDLAKVVFLNLVRTKITDAGLKEVAKLQQLSTLNLRHTKTTDAGLKDVAKMKQLKELYMENTQVTKAGVAELQKALPKCKIRSNYTSSTE